MLVAPVKSPAGETNEVWWASESCVLPAEGPGTNRLIARSEPASASRWTGSVSATPPTGMVIEVAPPKVSARNDPARTEAPVARTPTLAAPTVNGSVPCALEKRTRRTVPPSERWTTSRRVTPVKTGAEPKKPAICMGALQLPTQRASRPSPSCAAAAPANRQAISRLRIRHRARAPPGMNLFRVRDIVDSSPLRVTETLAPNGRGKQTAAGRVYRVPVSFSGILRAATRQEAGRQRGFRRPL